MQQHAAYEQALETLGVQLVRLPAQPELPDAVFVEDTAVVLDEIAVICAMGAESRALEVQEVAAALAPYRPTASISPPATLEGGDVLRIERKLYVGKSSRTNDAGIEQLSDLVAPLGYSVQAVETKGCLHLKTAVSYLGRNTLLVNPDWIEMDAFSSCHVIPVPPEEAMGANILPIGEILVLPASAVATSRLLEMNGFNKSLRLDLSEFHKAEAGPTCLSILFGLSLE